MTSLISYNANNLTVESCILELVKDSLKRKASRIAVRFDPRHHQVQVVDNGEGLSWDSLARIFELSGKENPATIHNLVRVRSSAVIVTSRRQASEHTYVRVASGDGTYRQFEGYHRPSHGTTVTAYDFNPIPNGWTTESSSLNSAIAYVLTGLALIELEVSISLRNDEQQRMLLNIGKPHSPWQVLKYINNWRFEDGQTSKSLLQRNNDDVSDQIGCKLMNLPEPSLRSFAVKFLEGSTFVGTNFEGSTDEDEEDDDDYDYDRAGAIFSPITEWSEWSYKSKPGRFGADCGNTCGCDDKIFSSFTGQIDTTDDPFVNLSQLSVWSNWSYQPQCMDNFLPNSLFRQLPICRLSNILRDKNVNQNSQHMLIDKFDNFRVNDENENRMMTNQNLGGVRTRKKPRLVECRLSMNTINTLQVLKQINNEFIAAITNENGNKMLILIDQHAVHERIRYEWLIENYRDDKSKNYFSKKLNEDLYISGIDSHLLKLLISCKKVLPKVGIHIKSIVDANTCIVDAVPICFLKRIKNYKLDQNMYRLMRNIRQLLIEVAKGLTISTRVLPPILPVAINNVIASEACHGAIKFGDPLNVQECTLLIRALQDTKVPTRCAHGRPSIIPLLDLSDFEKRKYHVKTKLNFNNLRRHSKNEDQL